MSEPIPIRVLAPSKRRKKRLRTPNPQVRERIFLAADDLIREQGFQELRVDEIAERASVSVGTFYLYFESKDDLFAGLVARHTEEIRAHRRVAVEKARTLAERLELSLVAYFDFVESNKKGFLYFRNAPSLQTTAGDLKSWAFEQHAKDLRPLVEEGIRAGTLRPMDPELLVQAILGAMQHIAGYWLEHKDRFTRDQILAFLRDLSVYQLAPRPEESAS